MMGDIFPIIMRTDKKVTHEPEVLYIFLHKQAASAQIHNFKMFLYKNFSRQK